MIKRVLCLDVGEKRIGVAVSDPLGITAQGVKTIFTRGVKNDVESVRELMKAYDTDRVVIGLPKSMDGQEGYQAGRVRDFANNLTEADVRFYDERLTSVSAERTLIEGGVSRKKRREVIDKLAATYILQAFLDAGGWREIKAEERKMDEFENNIVELEDEQGATVKFEHLCTVTYEENEYAVLTPYIEDLDDDEEQEVVIMRIVPGEEEDEYIAVEDDETADKVFNIFLEMMDDAESEDE